MPILVHGFKHLVLIAANLAGIAATAVSGAGTTHRTSIARPTRAKSSR
jgi:hypothetical protein